MSKTYIRRASFDDAANLLKWKNDPTMRKYSIVTSKKITMKDHMVWLKKHINQIYIIGEEFGDIRVSGKEVAIKLAPEYRGKGYGLEALRAIHRLFKDLTAKIVDGNIASFRLFLKAGYKPVAHRFSNGVGYYILKR